MELTGLEGKVPKGCFHITYMMEYKVPLRNREKHIIAYALVSREDFDNVNKHRWYKKDQHSDYVKSSSKIHAGKHILLHHFILGKPQEGYVVDHINGDPLDNRRENLRHVTYTVNAQNKPVLQNVTSKYNGVSACGSKWKAQYARTYLGVYDDEVSAAKAYDEHVYKVHQHHAKANILVYGMCTETAQNTKKERNLPKYIVRYGNSYRADKQFANKRYRSKLCETIEEALNELERINDAIELVKTKRMQAHNNLTVLKESSGNAIIPIYNKVKQLVCNAIVDESMWYELSTASWHADKTGYIKNNEQCSMHYRVLNITQLPRNLVVDHINGIRHDNRKSNLRVITRSGNSHNKVKATNTTSKYYGVHLTINGTWQSRISHDSKFYYLGTYKNEIDAALAYNKKATELYGDVAKLNDIVEEDKMYKEAV